MLGSQMTSKKQGPVIESGQCRCCGFRKKCRILTEQYIHNGNNEVYTEMMMDCFGVLLSNMDGDETDRLICAQCVVQLRESLRFKFQVLKCEELLLKTQDEHSTEVEIKVEPEETTAIEPEPLAEDHESKDEDSKTEMKLLYVPFLEEAKLTKANPVRKVRKIKMNAQELLKRDLFRSRLKLKKLVEKKTPGTSKLEPKAGMMKPTPLNEQYYNDLKALDNIITLVKYSYVCPFKTRISNYYCFYCKQIHTDPNELREHTLEHSPQHFEALVNRRKKTKLDISRIDCRLCSRTINTIDAFKTHIKSEHNKKYEDSDDIFIKFKLNDKLQCLECDKNFIFIDKLIEHMTEHFGRYVCEICGMCFIEESSMQAHTRTHNKVTTTYQCDKCGKELKSLYGRKLHVATVHEKRPIIGCYKCDSTFLSYAQRNRHLINIHGDNRRYTCTHCNKVFDIRKGMIQHVRKYHTPAVPKYKCKVCGEKFLTERHLKAHLKCHQQIFDGLNNYDV